MRRAAARAGDDVQRRLLRRRPAGRSAAAAPLRGFPKFGAMRRHRSSRAPRRATSGCPARPRCRPERSAAPAWARLASRVGGSPNGSSGRTIHSLSHDLVKISEPGHDRSSSDLAWDACHGDRTSKPPLCRARRLGTVRNPRRVHRRAACGRRGRARGSALHRARRAGHGGATAADGGRLVYAGAGTSGRLAIQDGAELTPTFSWPADRLVLLMAGGSKALIHAVEGAEDDRARRRDGAQQQVGPTTC